MSVPPSRCSDERGFALVLSPVVHFKSFVLNVNGHLPKYSSKILEFAPTRISDTKNRCATSTAAGPIAPSDRTRKPLTTATQTYSQAFVLKHCCVLRETGRRNDDHRSPKEKEILWI